VTGKRPALTRLHLLARELSLDLEAMRAHAGVLAADRKALDSRPRNRTVLNSAALEAHAWYTAVEGALERVLREVDRDVPSGPRSHVELLQKACLDLPRLRPPVLTEETREALEGVLKLRHFVRHGYRVPVIREKLLPAVDLALKTWPAIEEEMERFIAFVEAAAESLSVG
jgi:hypothetical protein